MFFVTFAVPILPGSALVTEVRFIAGAIYFALSAFILIRERSEIRVLWRSVRDTIAGVVTPTPAE